MMGKRVTKRLSLAELQAALGIPAGVSDIRVGVGLQVCRVSWLEAQPVAPVPGEPEPPPDDEEHDPDEYF